MLRLGCHSNRNRGPDRGLRGTGSHVTGTGSDITGTGSDVMTTGSGEGENRGPAGKKDRGLRPPEVTWLGRENCGGSAGSESKVQIRHRGEV